MDRDCDQHTFAFGGAGFGLQANLTILSKLDMSLVRGRNFLEYFKLCLANGTLNRVAGQMLVWR